MKPIEKLADNHVSDVKSSMEADGVDMSGRVAGLCLGIVKESFIRGMKQMREELTRWRDPKEQPEDGCICLLKFQSNGFFVHYEGGIFTEKDGEWHDSENMFTYNRDAILAWRPMHDMS